MHLICDCTGGDGVALDSMDVVRGFLRAAPELLGMTPINDLLVLRHEPEKGVDGGLTGDVIIAESHISIHTFPQVGAAMIDVCSCKPFDAAPVLALIKEAFAFRSVRHQIVKRMLLPSLTGSLAG